MVLNDSIKQENNELLIKDNEIKISHFQAAFNVILDSVPATFGLMFIFLTETINISFIGHKNDQKLIAGIGLGTLYINATGYILGAGLIGGLDTLGAQSVGAQKWKMLGIYANITRLTVLIFFIFISLPFIVFSKFILTILGLDEDIIDAASIFSYSMIPSLFFALQYNTTLRYLQAQNIFNPGMIITLSTALLHSLWCYIYIIVFDLGVKGAGYAMGTTQLLNLIIISIYCEFKLKNNLSYFYIDKNILNTHFIKMYLVKAVPAGILFSAEWFGFEVLILMASFLSELELASNVCVFNFITLIFMIPMGLSLASTALVGSAVGSNNVKLAKTYAIAALSIDLILISIISILIYTFRLKIPYLYTKNEEIGNLVADVLKIYLCFNIVDSISVVTHGIIKGLGKQKQAAIAVLIVLYPVNISMAYYIAFIQGYRIYGLWYSQLISIFILALCFISIVIFNDWKAIAKNIENELNKGELEMEN